MKTFNWLPANFAGKLYYSGFFTIFWIFNYIKFTAGIVGLSLKYVGSFSEKWILVQKTFLMKHYDWLKAHVMSISFSSHVTFHLLLWFPHPFFPQKNKFVEKILASYVMIN